MKLGKNKGNLDNSEWRRVCQHCNTQWFATTEEAPTDRDFRKMKRRSFGKLRLAPLEEQRTRVLAQQRCPACGSQSYVQELVPITTR